MTQVVIEAMRMRQDGVRDWSRGNRASKLWIDCCLNRRFGKSQFVGTSKIRVSSNGVRCVHVIY